MKRRELLKYFALTATAATAPALLPSRATAQSVVETATSEDCVEQFFTSEASPLCYELFDVDLLLEIRLNFRSGAYSSYGGKLVVKQVKKVEKENGDTEEVVSTLLVSDIVTSRLGEMYEDFVLTLEPFTVDEVGLAGYPLLDLSGTAGFIDGDWIFIHAYQGDEGSIDGSKACVRADKFAELRPLVDGVQGNGGNVSAVIIHDHG